MKFAIVLLLLGLHSWVFAQREAVFQINERLGRGINLGNMFEAPSEGAWDNPFREEYLESIAALGFDHIRIPIRWDTPERTLMDAPYTLNPKFLERISEVVEAALKKDLLVIINMHHHDLLFRAPELHKARFLAQWEQISDHFNSYPEELLFEVMNEPHDELTPSVWNEFFTEALKVIRMKNPQRGVLMGTAEFGGVSGIHSLEPPEDDYLIITVHYYSPFTFTHQGAEWVGGHSQEWLGTKWYNLNAEREAIANEFEALERFSEKYQLPMHIGEFGAYEKADFPSRVAWTNFVSRYVDSLGFSWAYWEWSAGFGIFDPETNAFKQELVDALLHEPLPEAQESYPQTLLETTFEADLGGWNLNTQSGAQASLQQVEDQLQVAIQQHGTEDWHVQLSLGGIPLREGQVYRVSFRASASQDFPITQYLGESISPFRAYTGYNRFQIEETPKDFSYVFTMNQSSDDQARAVVDLGNRASTFRMDNFRLDQLNFLVASQPLHDPEKVKLLYPNPFENHIFIPNTRVGDEVEVFDLQGRNFGTYTVSDNGVLLLTPLPPGSYVLRIANRPEMWMRAIKK
jgi:endoglucanase